MMTICSHHMMKAMMIILVMTNKRNPHHEKDGPTLSPSPVDDSYKNLAVKTRAAVRWIASRPHPPAWFYKIDDGAKLCLSCPPVFRLVPR